MTELTPIQMRQEEVAQYEEAIALYQTIAASLPSEYPAHLVEFKHAADKHETIAKIDNLADVELLSDLWAHDDAQAAIRSNIVEKRKAEAILAALEA
jgi:hypothetical protein